MNYLLIVLGVVLIIVLVAFAQHRWKAQVDTFIAAAQTDVDTVMAAGREPVSQLNQESSALAMYNPWSQNQAGYPYRYWVQWSKHGGSPPALEGTGAYALQESIHSPAILGVIATAIEGGLRDQGFPVRAGDVHILGWQRFEEPSPSPSGRDSKPLESEQSKGNVIAFSRVA